MKKLAIILQNGVEEMEAITTIDILRRGNLVVDLFATQDLTITGSHQIQFLAEKKLADLKAVDYDGIIIPGGPAVDKLLNQTEILQLVQEFANNQKLVAAICAAPQILGKVGLLKGKKVTHYPTAGKFMEGALEQLEIDAIIQGNIITGSGPGAAVPFALTIVEYLNGVEAKNNLKKMLNYRH